MSACVYASLALGLLAGTAAARDKQDVAPSVLIFHSYQRVVPFTLIVEDTLRKVVPEALQRPVNMYSEHLDLESGSTESFAAAQADFLQKKYDNRNVRVIVASGLPALQFAVKFRDQKFSGVPVVHLAVAKDRLDKVVLPPDVVGHTESHDPTPTVQLAQRLHPNATRLVVVRGASEADRLWDDRVRAAVERAGNALEVEYLSGLSTAEVQRRLGSLPSTALVFTPGYIVDGAGELSTAVQSTERIARASTVPVYGALPTLVGAGVVGGYVTRFEDQGKEAGAIVVRLLNGAAAAEIEPATVARVPMVDWRQIRRWGLDESLLPAGSVVRFKEPSIWEVYRWHIAAAILLIVMQSVLIAALLLQRRQRRIAEIEVRQQRTELARASRLAALGELSASIAHEVNQPLGAISSNADAVELLLDAEPPKLEDARRVLLDLKLANQRASDVVLRIRQMLGKREVAFEPYDLNAAAAEVVRLLDTDTMARGVDVRTEFQSLPLVRGDRWEFQQLLLNLILNGMDAMAETSAGGRQLNVRTLPREDRHVEIAVADTGGGIDAADMAHLFDSYFTTKKEGMGLGLALCRSIVQAHGGRIWAENNPGGGATFRVVLPIDAQQRVRVLSSRLRGIIENDKFIAHRTHSR